jgi:hypothetical protein
VWAEGLNIYAGGTTTNHRALNGKLGIIGCLSGKRPGEQLDVIRLAFEATGAINLTKGQKLNFSRTTTHFVTIKSESLISSFIYFAHPNVITLFTFP